MPNPYMAASFRTPTAGAPPDHPPIGRLRRCGLLSEEIPQVKADWAAMTGEERLWALEALSYLSDDELRADIENNRGVAAGIDGER